MSPAPIIPGLGEPSLRALEQLSNALQQGPLALLFAGFGTEAAQSANSILLRALLNGDNPLVAARALRTALNTSLYRAQTIARTEMLNAYRDSNLANYQANSDVVDGWVWTADLSARTCFPRGTMIQTSKGQIPIEQMELGDEVLTHEGRYKRVTVVMARPYSGEMITVNCGEHSVTATVDHPFLIERQGELYWIEAGHIRLGDHAICYREGATDIADHTFSQIAIEGRIRQADNGIAPALQEQRLAGVSSHHIRPVMPVHAVNLQNSIQAGQEEINRISPAIDKMLLRVGDTQRFQAHPGVLFRFGFASEATVTAWRAEKAIPLFGRTDTKRFSALSARLSDGWASAFLRAVGVIRTFLTKNLVTPLTSNIDRPHMLTGIRTIDLVSHARRSSKSFSANRTNFLMAFMGFTAFKRAVVSQTPLLYAKRFTTAFANQIETWFRLFAALCMGAFPLIDSVASIGTKPPIAFALPRFGNDKRLSADFTGQFNPFRRVCRFPGITAFFATIRPFLSCAIADVHPGILTAHCADAFEFPSIARIALNIKSFHASIISQLDHHIQRDTTVYNLEVEGDHSYVADGFVVHNCAACIAQNGTLHSLDETMDEHVCGHCSPIPHTKSWSDILNNAGYDTSGLDLPDSAPTLPSGADWFAAQSADVQQQVLGKAGYALYQSGTPLADFVGIRQNAQYGPSIYVKSMKELQGG